MGNVSVRSLVSEPFFSMHATPCISPAATCALFFPTLLPQPSLLHPTPPSSHPLFSRPPSRLATVPTRLFFQPILLCPGSGLFHFCLPPHFSCRSESRQSCFGNINNPAGPCETSLGYRKKTAACKGLSRVTAKSCDKNGGDESDRLDGLTPPFFFAFRASQGGGSCSRLFHSSSLPFFCPFPYCPLPPPILPAMLSQSHPIPFICLLSPPSLSSRRCRH